MFELFVGFVAVSFGYPFAMRAAIEVYRALLWVWNPSLVIFHTTTKDAWRMILAEGFRPPTQEGLLGAKNRYTYFQAGEDSVSFGAWNQPAYMAMVRNVSSDVFAVFETRQVRIRYRQVRRLGFTEAVVVRPGIGNQTFGKGIEVVVPRSVVNAELLRQFAWADEIPGKTSRPPRWLALAGYAGITRHVQQFLVEQMRLSFSPRK